MLERDIYRERMFLKGTLLLLTALFLGTFLWAALHRMGYPYEIEWREGLNYEAAVRITEGKPLYAAPSLEWIPPAIGPLYLYFCAGLMELSGNSLAVMRLVSILATVGAGMVLYRILRETGVEDVFALTGFGIFLGVYKVSGGWYDIARADMFALFLGMSAITLALLGPNRKNAILAGVFAAAAGFARTDYFLLIPLIGVHYVLKKRSLLKYFLAPGTLISAGMFIIFHLNSGGWYWQYAVKEPFAGNIDYTRLASFWTNDLSAKFPILIMLSLGGLYGLIRHFLRKQVSYSDSLMAIFTVSFLILALWKRMYLDSGGNAIIPAIPVIAGLTAWSLQHFNRNEYGLGYLFPVLFMTLTIVQMCLFIFRPHSMIPDPNDAEAGKRMISQIEVYPEPLYIPNHPLYYRSAGCQSWVDYSRLTRCVENDKTGAFKAIADSLGLLIGKEYFSTIITDDENFGMKDKMLEKYRLYDTIFIHDTDFIQKTGMAMKPQYVYMAK